MKAGRTTVRCRVLIHFTLRYHSSQIHYLSSLLLLYVWISKWGTVREREREIRRGGRWLYPLIWWGGLVAFVERSANDQECKATRVNATWLQIYSLAGRSNCGLESARTNRVTRATWHVIGGLLLLLELWRAWERSAALRWR